MNDKNYQLALEQRCGFKEVLTRDECVSCPGYDSNCPFKIDYNAPDQEALEKYKELKLTKSS